MLTIDDMLDEENLEKVGIDISDIRVDWRAGKSQKWLILQLGGANN